MSCLRAMRSRRLTGIRQRRVHECMHCCFRLRLSWHGFMKADLRMSVKDYRRNKNLKMQLTQVPFAAARQFWVRMNGHPWPRTGQPVSVTRLLTALRKALVRAACVRKRFAPETEPVPAPIGAGGLELLRSLEVEVGASIQSAATRTDSFHSNSASAKSGFPRRSRNFHCRAASF